MGGNEGFGANERQVTVTIGSKKVLFYFIGTTSSIFCLLLKLLFNIFMAFLMHFHRILLLSILGWCWCLYNRQVVSSVLDNEEVGAKTDYYSKPEEWVMSLGSPEVRGRYKSIFCAHLPQKLSGR